MAITIGYVRVSTPRQRPQRQEDNIKKEYPDAIIYVDKYTGTKMDRPAWAKVVRRIQPGDTIVFDEVSRMSRNAEEGFEVYQELFHRDISLVFLKEPHINTEIYKNALTKGVPLTGTNVDLILEGINQYLMALAKEQIFLAFSQAQKEVDFLHKRVSEGVRRAQLDGKTVGRPAGMVVVTKKEKRAKPEIKRLSVSFGGSLSDKDLIRLLAINRKTFYRYKRELLEEEAVQKMLPQNFQGKCNNATK